MHTNVVRQYEQVIILMNEIGERLKLQGDNRFRAQAYTRAADSLRALTRPLTEVIAAGELTSIPGIGSAIASVVERLYETGSDPTLEKLRKDIPNGVLEMLSIPGMRTSQILRLHRLIPFFKPRSGSISPIGILMGLLPKRVRMSMCPVSG